MNHLFIKIVLSFYIGHKTYIFKQFQRYCYIKKSYRVYIILNKLLYIIMFNSRNETIKIENIFCIRKE